MSPIHLSDFVSKTLSYSEHERRFCLKREEGTHLRAYDIDVNGADQQYFKRLYLGMQNRRSADGIYVGSFHERGKQIQFVIIIELEGRTSFTDSAEQVRQTMEHFCQHFQDNALDDDGMRHHQQAGLNPRPYIVDAKHVVAGIVIGSTSREGVLTRYQQWPIICLNSRQPVQDKTPLALLEEIANYTGERFW